jgi:hypothetical protein
MWVSDISYVADESRIEMPVETESKIKLGCQAVNGRVILQVSLKNWVWERALESPQ